MGVYIETMKSRNQTVTECGFMMKQITDYISKASNNLFRKKELTLRQISILAFLYRKGEKTPLKAIEAEFHISQPTVAGVTRRLEKKKLIELKTSSENSSAKTASLTESGTAVYLESRKHSSDMEDAILKGLTPQEITDLQKTLAKILNNLYRR